MSRFVSLRGVISFIAALSVAVVAAITLSITLTSSLAALRDVGSGQAAALLRAAELSSENLFAAPQDALETLQNTSRQRAWEWPANSQAARDEWMSLHTAMLLDSRSRIFALLTYFRDETAMFLASMFEPSAPFAPTAPYIGTRVLFGTPVNATEPRSTVNQTGMPPEGRMYHTSNWSSVPIGDPAFAALLPPREFSPFTSTVVWTGNMIITSGGRYAATAGVLASAVHGVGESMIAFIAPLHRAGETPGFDAPYALSYAAMSFSDLSRFLKESRATPGTLAVAVQRSGFIMASSAADSKPFQSTVVAPLGTPAQPGCNSAENTNTIKFDPTNFIICRTHAKDYDHAGLAAVVADEEFAFATSRQLRILSTDDGVYFAGSVQVPIRFRGAGVHLIILMPEIDVIGDVVRSQNAAIGITCGVFVIVAVIVFVAITLLLEPLGTIAERMQRAADFDDDGADGSVSAMSEVAALQLAYYEMNDELNRIRSFVPQSVLVAKRAVDEDLESAVETSTDTGTVSVRSKRSAKSSAAGRSHGGKSSGGAAMSAPSAATDAGLVLRHVSILVADVRGFSHVAASSTSQARDFGTAASSIVAAVEKALADTGGVLGGFHGDHFTATYNAVQQCSAASRRACSAAHALTEHQCDGLQFHVGVAAGKCYIGNIGTATAKTFSTLGHPFRQAVMLERLSRLYGPECHTLVTSRVFMDIATNFRYRVVDHVLMPPRQPMLVAALLGPIHAEDEADPRSVNADEWLYVVGGHADGDINAARNRAFDHLARCELDLCEACLSQGPARDADTRPHRAEDDGSVDVDAASKTSSPEQLTTQQPAGITDNLSSLVATLRHTHGSGAPLQSRMRRQFGPVSLVGGFWESFLRPE